MKSLSASTMRLLLVTGLTVLGCSPQMSGQDDAGWIALLDGSNPKTLDNWNRIGNANWRAEDGTIVADKGKGGHLVSKNSYKDFQIRAEFWADHTTNSGIFLRISDPKTIGSKSAYEANIYDQRPEPEYGTGAIANVCKVSPMPKAGGKWNNYEITAKGSHLTIMLNGVRQPISSTPSSRKVRSRFSLAIVKKEPPAASMSSSGETISAPSNGARCRSGLCNSRHPQRSGGDCRVMAPTSRTEIAVDVFLRRDDISGESKQKLLVDNPARVYGL